MYMQQSRWSFECLGMPSTVTWTSPATCDVFIPRARHVSCHGLARWAVVLVDRTLPYDENASSTSAQLAKSSVCLEQAPCSDTTAGSVLARYGHVYGSPSLGLVLGRRVAPDRCVLDEVFGLATERPDRTSDVSFRCEL
jgi:hypothetical protein